MGRLKREKQCVQTSPRTNTECRVRRVVAAHCKEVTRRVHPLPLDRPPLIRNHVRRAFVRQASRARTGRRLLLEAVCHVRADGVEVAALPHSNRADGHDASITVPPDF